MMIKKRTIQLVLAGLILFAAPAFAGQYECLYLEQVDHIDAKVDKYLDFYVKNGSGGPALVGAKDCDQKACHATVFCKDTINGGTLISNTYCRAIKDEKGNDSCPSATICANDIYVNSNAHVALAAPRTTTTPASKGPKAGGKTGDVK